MWSVLMIVIAVMLVSAVVLSLYSRKKAPYGLVTGMLGPCPDMPNCICSEYPDQTGFVAPLAYDGEAEVAWALVKSAVRDSGGRIVHEEAFYLSATYTSLVFRFVDDLELRLDEAAKRIHIRSASRVGYSDLGANRKRVANIRTRYSTLSL
jgi:uncharacterized protein (DUF1499 family)